MALNAENLSHNMGVKNLYESDLDDENYSSVENYGIRELRRKLHTEAEQRRRNAIKRGFESLLELVHPIKNDPAPSVRMSKSSILHKAVSMIERLGRQKHQKLSEVESLEREVKALRILCLNYEKMVQNSPNSDCRSVEPVSDEMKLEVFQMFSGALFNSFEDHIVFNSFSDLSASVINWIEESCKPEEMAFLMDSVLASIFNWSFEASVIGSRTLQFSSLSSQTERNNDIQSCCDSAGSKHPLVRSSPVYSYSPSDLQISANHSSCNPTVDPEKLVPQLSQTFSVQSPGNSISAQITVLQCPSESQSLTDLNFQQTGSSDLCEGNGFYNFGSFIPKNINPMVDHSSLPTDTIMKDPVSPHLINSSCTVMINEINLTQELPLHNSSHIQQYKQFIDDLL